MKKFRCPNCGKEAIPFTAKLAATPGVVSIKCPECGETIYADYGVNPVCWLPVLVGCLLLRYIDGLLFKVIVLSVFGVASLVWYTLSSELITKRQYTERKKRKNQQANIKPVKKE